MSNHSIKTFLPTLFLLMVAIPIFAADCKSIRSAYLKENHRCIGLFRKAYAPEKQPLTGDIVFNDDNVNTCFDGLKLNYPEFSNNGECIGIEDVNIDKNFDGYVKKCLHQNNFSECENVLSNVKNVDNIRNSVGATLLMIAAQEGDIDAMDFLLQKGASAKKVNHRARTLLHYAVAPKTEKFHNYNDTNEIILNVVKKVIDLGVSPQEMGLSGWTPFCSAILNSSNDIVDLLLKAGANLNLRCPTSGKEQERLTPLFFAIQKNDFEKVSLLLNAGANPNMISQLPSLDDPPLATAIWKRNLNIVKALVDAGADVNTNIKYKNKTYQNILTEAESAAKDDLKCECDNTECEKNCIAAVEKDDIVVFLKRAGAKKRSDDDLIDLRDGQSYKTVKIGNQIWMAENLNYKSNESKCSENKEENCEKYGKLYPVYSEGNVCPSGWRVPSIKDWYQLFANIGVKKKCESFGYGNKCDYLVWDYAGNKLNEKGFNILLGGQGFGGIGTQADFAAVKGNSKSESRYIAAVDLDFCFKHKSKKNFQASDYCHQDSDGMYSVRCVRDNQEKDTNNEIDIKMAKQEALDILKLYRTLQEAFYSEQGKVGSLLEIGFDYSYTFFDYTEQKNKGMYISPKKSMGTCTTGKKISISPISKNKGEYSVIAKFNCKIDPGCEMFASSVKSICK